MKKKRRMKLISMTCIFGNTILNNILSVAIVRVLVKQILF